MMVGSDNYRPERKIQADQLGAPAYKKKNHVLGFESSFEEDDF